MDIDYRLAFDLAPVGLALSRERYMVDCNQALCEMFGATRFMMRLSAYVPLRPSKGAMRAPRRSYSSALG